MPGDQTLSLPVLGVTACKCVSELYVAWK